MTAPAPARPFRLPTLDSSLAFVTEGYPFILGRSRQYGTPVFGTRLLGLPVICLSGEEAARLFYDPDRFERRGAMPGWVLNTFLGQGSVQTLDVEAHRQRKAAFMSLMTPGATRDLAGITFRQWYAHAAKWEVMDRVVLLEEARDILCRAVCEWSGVPLPEEEVGLRARQLAALFDAPGSVGPRHWRGRLARPQAEAWTGELIRQVRAGELPAPEGRALHVFALHRDLDGKLLDEHTAAVELLNILRPVVAIMQFVAFTALALHEHPGERERLRVGDDAAVTRFVQEVRRTAPFFPAVPALARRDFVWRGVQFCEGDWVLLDLYGTSREEGVWEDPDQFRPERFERWNGSPFNFIPQGGGDHWLGHRCAGEWVTTRLMKVAVRFLTRHLSYDVPTQDLRVKFTRFPSQPESGFVMTNVRRTAE